MISISEDWKSLGDISVPYLAKSFSKFMDTRKMSNII